jgi:hypothetical protein
MPVQARFVRLIGALMIAGAALLPTSALAADPVSKNPEQPVVLTGRHEGSLPARPTFGWHGKDINNGFAYYKFEYPGNSSPITINMQVYPDDATILGNRQVGFTLYGPRTAREPGFVYLRGGGQPKLSPNVTADFQSTDPGTYVVQVYNESPIPISYTIWATGLPAQKAEPALVPVPAAPAPAPAAPRPAAPAAAPSSSSFGGPGAVPAAPAAPAPAAVPAAAAALDPKTLVPPASALGAGWTQSRATDEGSNAAVKVHTVQFNAGPADAPNAAVVVAAAVAQNDAARDQLLPALQASFERQGYKFEPSTEYGDRPGLRATLSQPPVVGLLRAFAIRNVGVLIAVIVPTSASAEGERLLTALAQAEQMVIAQALAVPAPALGPAPATTGATLSSGRTLTGTLGPNKSETFQLDYPGNEAVYTIDVQVTPDDEALLQRAGLRIYQPSGALQVKGGTQPKLRPNVSANVITRVPGTYTVQLFNDNPGATISYTITLSAK